MKKTYVIIGNSAAGLAAMRTVRKLDADAHIICYSDQTSLPYNTCFLADALSGDKTFEKVMMLDQALIEKLSIDMRLGQRVLDIESDNNLIMLSSGKKQAYDYLLLATGSRPYLPLIKGMGDFANVCTFHTLADTICLDQLVKEPKNKRAVVIGAGLSGLEAADALHARGIEVTVVERDQQVLNRHITSAGASILERHMKSLGITLYKKSSVVQVMSVEGRATQVMLSDGTCIPMDMLVIAAGMKQNSELAHTAGLAIDQHGVVVNEFLQTSQPAIYAAGDIIGVTNLVTGGAMASCTWPDAMQQGMHAAYAMVGQPRAYKGAHIIVSSAFFGLKFASCGLLSDVPATYTVKEQSGTDFYHRYLFHGAVLKGFILVGNTQRLPALKRALLTGQPFF